jgi:hypothetical protein
LPSPNISQGLLDFHRRNNRQSLMCWDQFAEHRATVTRLAIRGGGERLCVLGAGNANDLDIVELCARFREIHLVDIDEQALRRARDKQLPDCAARLVLHAPVDVSGALDRLVTYVGERPTPAHIADLPDACAKRMTSTVPGDFDTVVSGCVLSQIMVDCRRALGEDHPDLAALSTALAAAHVRSMVRLLRPGGTGVFVSDTSTSKLYPALEELFARHSPADLLARLEASNSVFLGTRSSTILTALASDPEVAASSEAGELQEPWLWRMGPLVLLAYAIVFKRRGLE